MDCGLEPHNQILVYAQQNVCIKTKSNELRSDTFVAKWLSKELGV